MKDTLFYNKESAQYSDKRYPRVAHSYTQFFFKRRLRLTKAFLRAGLAKMHAPLTLLEVGCADGIVVREIQKDFPQTFAHIAATDISPGMIDEARKKNMSSTTEFFVRDQYRGEPVDVVIETGVINYAHFETELDDAYTQLKPGGIFIFSIAGTESLINRLKPLTDFNDFRTYTEYDRITREKFIVHQVHGCGFFVPYLWWVPVVARLVQGVIDPFAGFFLPNLCHEKLYLVEKK
jgi:SAM-dependent methyltransferase